MTLPWFGESGTERESTRWENWAETLRVSGTNVFSPRSEADVIKLIERAASQGRNVRAAGSGHSWSPLVPTQDFILCSEELSDPLEPGNWVEERNGHTLVNAGPGLNQGKLQRITQPRGLAFPTLGVVYDIQLGGFIAAGCHGTGWQQPTVPDLVHSMRMVMADGSVREFSEDKDPEEMNFARVHLGSVGFVTQMSFKTVPMFNAHAVDEVCAMSEIVDRDDPSVLASVVTSDENPYVELFWFPFNTEGEDEGQVWFKHYKPTDKPVDNKVPSHVFDRIETEFAQAPYYAASFDPKLTPGLLRTLWKLLPDSQDYIANVPDVYHYQHYTYPVTDLSFAIPIRDGDFSNVVKAWYDAVDGISAAAQRGKYPVNVALHARFIKNSQALLSPAYAPAGSDTHFCFIEVLTFQPRKLASHSLGVQQFHEFAKEIGLKWMSYDGRPHWAKAFQDVPGVYDHIRESYGGNLTRWLKWRDQLDPSRMFWNDFMGQIFSV